MHLEAELKQKPTNGHLSSLSFVCAFLFLKRADVNRPEPVGALEQCAVSFIRLAATARGGLSRRAEEEGASMVELEVACSAGALNGSARSGPAIS